MCKRLFAISVIVGCSLLFIATPLSSGAAEVFSGSSTVNVSKIYSAAELTAMSKADLITLVLAHERKDLLDSSTTAVTIASTPSSDKTPKHVSPFAYLAGALLIGFVSSRHSSTNNTTLYQAAGGRPSVFAIRPLDITSSSQPAGYNTDRCQFSSVLNTSFDAGEKLAQSQATTKTRGDLPYETSLALPWVKLGLDLVYYKCM